MGRDPDGPASHNSRLKVGLDLGDVLVPALTLNKIQVSEEHTAKDGVPHGLIDKDLGGNGNGLGSWQLGIQESVEEMSGGTVKEEAEGTQTNGTHGIIGCAVVVDELLGEDITYRETDEGCAHLGKERLSLEDGVVSCPESHDSIVFIGKKLMIKWQKRI